MISKALALMYAATADELLQGYFILFDLMLLIRLSGDGVKPSHICRIKQPASKHYLCMVTMAKGTSRDMRGTVCVR